MKKFEESIVAMNKMYKLPVESFPTTIPGEPLATRMEKFQRTLRKEIDEGDEIIAAANKGNVSDLDLVTAVADILGDIVIYCFSEAAKYGIPLGQVLEIIMKSNESKLGADGLPIYDKDGKFLKGPNYWAPEEDIFDLLLNTGTTA